MLRLRVSEAFLAGAWPAPLDLGVEGVEVGEHQADVQEQWAILDRRPSDQPSLRLNHALASLDVGNRRPRSNARIAQRLREVHGKLRKQVVGSFVVRPANPDGASGRTIVRPHIVDLVVPVTDVLDVDARELSDWRPGHASSRHHDGDGLLAGRTVAAVGEPADQLPRHVACLLGAAEAVLSDRLLVEEILDGVGVEGEGLVEGVDRPVEVTGVSCASAISAPASTPATPWSGPDARPARTA